ncbi:hypothetical protein ILYODFUR_038628, partial [Ilyodon furcidens]
IDEDRSMTVNWDEFLHHVILNPVDNTGERVSSWKHSLVFDAHRVPGRCVWFWGLEDVCSIGRSGRSSVPHCNVIDRPTEDPAPVQTSVLITFVALKIFQH